LVNLSSRTGDEEGSWGYRALVAHRYQEAARWFRDAAIYQPQNAGYWYDLGIAYQGMDNQPAAVAAFRRAADQGEAKAQYYLGVLYESGGQGLPKDTAQALYWYGKAALQGEPDALNNVAWAYATSPNPAIRNPSTALEYALKATSLEKDNPDPSHLDTLAEAYYVNGQLEDAVKTEQQALVLASPDEKSELQKRLEKYQRAFENEKPPTAKK
jgi:hypothetical protein